MHTSQSSVLLGCVLLLGPKKWRSEFPNAPCDALLCVLTGRGLQRSLNPTQRNPTQLGWLTSHK